MPSRNGDKIRKMANVSQPNENGLIKKAVKENLEIFAYVQQRVHLLTFLIGDTTRPFNTYKGVCGLVIWILNILIHFSFDFYEAAYIFHASWATSIGIYLLCFVSCSIFTIKHSAPWFIKAVQKLARNELHVGTMKKLKFIFKVFPWLMPGFAAFGAGAQFGCYAYDGALRVNFNQAGNQTIVPESVELLLNVFRMTSLLHIFYAFWFYLLFHLVILFTIQASMKEFNGKMREALKKHPPQIPFSEAVELFSWRTKILQQCSKKTTVVLTIILLTTSVSFVVNAYNFLFVKRLAIYVWFALAPLIWTVSPLMVAAWVTSTYRQYKYVVIQAWVEIPEEFDQIWKRENEFAKKKVKTKTVERERLPGLMENISEIAPGEDTCEEHDSKSQMSDVDRRPTLSVKAESTKKWLHFHVGNSDAIPKQVNTTSSKESSSELPLACKENEAKYKKVTINIIENGNVGSGLVGSSSATDILIEENSSKEDLNNDNNTLLVTDTKRPLSAVVTKRDAEDRQQNSVTAPSLVIKNTFVENNLHSCELKENQSARRRISALSISPPQPSATGSQYLSKPFELSKVVGVRQTLERFKMQLKSRRKFNYEKYIKYLDCILITIGFSVGGVLVTWDRASFFCVILFTLVGVFAQEAFLNK